MTKADNTGKCEICGEFAKKTGMPRHLAECLPAHDTESKNMRLVQLRVEASGDRRYWVYVEAGANATLEQLDALLRAVWLDCCGHMSAFYLERSEPDKRSKIGTVLASKGAKFRYEYDFGSTTLLSGEVLGTREGSPGRTTVRLLARNDPPDWSCEECESPATTVCPYCVDEGGGLFCEAHAAKHSHADDGVYLPVVNSPRMGVCGYAG